MLFCNKAITLYNRVGDGYVSTVINNVNVANTQGANINSSGISDADKCKCYIPFGSLEKEYINPMAYKSLTNKNGYITFDSEYDFFVIGECLEAGDYNNLRKKYDVYKITTVDIYPDILPHYEIGGK